MATPDQTRERFVDELLGTATILLDVEQAAIAEAWASGAVAEWCALGGSVGELAPLVARSDEPAARLAATMIAALETGEMVSGPPEWLDEVGRHEVIRAIRLDDSPTNESAIILEYAAPSGDRHDISVTIQNGGVVGVSVGPEGLAAAAVEHEHLASTDIDPGDALERIRAALAAPNVDRTAASEASIPLLAARVGYPVEVAVGVFESAVVVPPERHDEDDRYAAGLIRSSMRAALDSPPPAGLRDVMAGYARLIADGDSDALTLFEIAGVAPESDIDQALFVRLVGAYLAPVSLAPHSPQQADALNELEPADWIGVVLGLGRSSAGVEVDGDLLVACINKCPEIATSIPKADSELVGWAFEQMLYAWRVTGLLTDDGRLTDVAAWVLPRAAIAAWES